MKSGSGNLDFGAQDDEESKDPVESDREGSSDSTTPSDEQGETNHSQLSDPASEPEGKSRSQLESQSTGDAEDETDTQEYPYFVRRSNVGDERDQRIEVHLRKEVNDQESDFRTALATHLETDEVPKTDAREFALKFAFENPEAVAELMRDEGFGLVD